MAKAHKIKHGRQYCKWHRTLCLAYKVTPLWQIACSFRMLSGEGSAQRVNARELPWELARGLSLTWRLLERGDRAKAWNENGVLSAGKISFSFATRGLLDAPVQYFYFDKNKRWNRSMKSKIKYAVNVLRRTNKLWRFFLYEENMQQINEFLTSRKINFLLWTKIRPNVKQISPWKKIASSLDSSKATIVSKALYNLEGYISSQPVQGYVWQRQR